VGALDAGGGAKKRKGGRKRPARRGRIRIDMTPMVDVAFLLLIFFMVTTVFRRPQALEITLPAEKAEIEMPENNVLQIRVTEAGRIYWNIGVEDPRPVEVHALHEVVGTHRGANPALAALIKIDRKAEYHWMVDILDEVALGNLERYGLAPFTEDDRLALEGGSAEGGSS
jgi:biopolymer transport protein ExbD